MEKSTNHEPRSIDQSIASPQLLQPLIQNIEANNETSNGVEEPVEDKGGGDEKGVALALHDGFLVAQVFGRAAVIGIAARGSGLVLPVDVHEQEEAERDDGEEGFEEGTSDGD